MSLKSEQLHEVVAVAPVERFEEAREEDVLRRWIRDNLAQPRGGGSTLISYLRFDLLNNTKARLLLFKKRYSPSAMTLVEAAASLVSHLHRMPCGNRTYTAPLQTVLLQVGVL